ncbi:unnamed protein product, partial [Ectocarpus sp. 12 AP-2014]
SDGQISGEQQRGAGGMNNTRGARRPWSMWGTMVVSTRMAVVVLLMADANNALSTTCSPGTVANTAKSFTCLCVSQQAPRPRRWSSSGRHGNERARAMSLGLFGLGGGGSGAKSRDGSPAVSKAERAVNSNSVFKRRMSQYAQGAITAGDLVRSLERDVVVLIPGCDLEDAVAAAVEATPDKRKRDLLSKASGGRAIGPGGATRRLGASRGGMSDVTIEGGRGQQYLMSQGGERISSGKSSIFNGVEVGKEGTPLKIKVTTRSNAALVAAEVSNLEQIRARNGAGAFSKHFVGFEENIDNYNGRGDFAMVMRAGSTDLRKLAEVNGGGLSQNKLRKYGAAMASAMRCVHKAGLVWTDLKVDNFVLCERDEAKAIDLEGAVPARSGPKSYTPATMPPDFVIASRGG